MMVLNISTSSTTYTECHNGTPFCSFDTSCDTTFHDIDFIGYLCYVSVQVSDDRLDQVKIKLSAVKDVVKNNVQHDRCRLF